VKDHLKAAGFCSDADVDDSNTMKKKVRNAQIAQYNFILVVGEKERKNGTVNVRTRDNTVRGEVSLDELVSRFSKLANERVLNSEETWECGDGARKQQRSPLKVAEYE